MTSRTHWLPLALASLAFASCELGTYDHYTAYRSDAHVSSDGCVPLPEICDGRDNDCDGLIDNDDPTLTANDTANCGRCGRACVLDHVEIAKCEAGQCGIVMCTPGYADANEIADDGCESDCVKTSDWDYCDGVDNDCNGVVDDGFDLDNDPNNCGDCGYRCEDQLPEAVYHVNAWTCVAGECAIIGCSDGWWDLDGEVEDTGDGSGCEYPCTKHFNVELCNGADDDCDGTVDNGPVDIPDCLTQGVCTGTTAVCDFAANPADPWTCTYPSTYQLIEDDALPCDGLDNDCDGRVDEGYGVGQPCSEGTGACRRTGHYVCLSDQSDSECDAVEGTPGVEDCDGVDNDCDGSVDELDRTDAASLALYGSFVYVNPGSTCTGVAAFTIFAHEASRPTATDTNAGYDDTGVPCSKATHMPWSNITAIDNAPTGNVRAEQACQRLGANWHLCSTAQWYCACAAGLAPSGGQAFPYGTTYAANTCNGYDYGNTHGGVGPRATGDLTACYRTWAGTHGGSIFDMSGNLKEWVGSAGTAPNWTSYELRGGAYNNLSSGSSAPGLQCSSTSPMPAGTEIHLPSIGFRCCYSGNLWP